MSTYEPTYLLTLTWGGRCWRLCTGDEDVRVVRGSGLADVFTSGLGDAPGWEEVVDPLQQVPAGGTALVEVDLGLDAQGRGWPARLAATGHRHYRARATLEAIIGGRVELLLHEAEVEALAWGAPDRPPGWASMTLAAAALPAGPPIADPDWVVQEDALAPPAVGYTYATTGQLMPRVFGVPGAHWSSGGLVYTPALTAWPAEVILGLDVERVIVGVDGDYSGTVRVYDSAGTYDDLPVEGWTDAVGVRWATVDTSGSVVLDLQSSDWRAAYTSGAITEPDTHYGRDLGRLGGLVGWCCGELGLSLVPMPGDGWEALRVAWVAEAAEGTVLELLQDVLLPSWPLALVRRADGWRVLSLVPSTWPTQPPRLVVGEHCEAAGPVQTVGTALDLASHVQVSYGLDAEGQPLGLVEVELPGAELLAGRRQVQLLSLPALVEYAGAQAAARAWGEVRWRPWLALEVLLPFAIRPPRAGDVRLLTDARLGEARRALVSIVRAARLGWSITLLVPA